MSMGWASEDDYDDSITVWETIPQQVPTKNQNADMDDSRLGGIFRIQSWSKVGEGHEEGAFYGEPTLRSMSRRSKFSGSRP